MVINSQKSIYKPNLKRVDSVASSSAGSKPPLNKQPSGTGGASGPPKTVKKAPQKSETAGDASTPASTTSSKPKSIYKPP